MLNDLVRMTNAIEALGIWPPRQDQRLAPMPNGETVVVSVDECGMPAEAQVLKTSETRLYKIRQDPTASNTSSFPGFNLPLEKLTSGVLRPYRYASELHPVFVNVSAELINFSWLLGAVSASTVDQAEFQAKLFSLLSAEWLAKKLEANKKKEKKLSVYLDLVPALRDPLQPRVAHTGIWKSINSHLLASNGKAAQTGTDHYSGAQAEIETVYPSLSVPKIGKLKLYSLNREAIPALDRYGMDNTFHVSSERVQQVCDTVKYLTAPEREGKTWAQVPSIKAKETDLLIAYINDPELLTELPGAAMFGESGGISDADFSALCQPAVKMLEAKLPVNPDLVVQLLILHKVTQGAQQVSLCREITAQELIVACQRWQGGAAIAPVVRLPLFDRQLNKTRLIQSHVTHPLALVSTINRLWSADKKTMFRCEYQHAFSTSDAFDVFLSGSPKKAERALSLLVERMSRVLGALGHSQIFTHQKGYFAFGEDARKYALKALPLIGVLLSLLQQRQMLQRPCDAALIETLLPQRPNESNYMNNTITQFGRLLSLMDDLHRQYCLYVRKGQMPTQLIGNSYFTSALARPLEAFVAANTRLKPYLGWAQTVRVTEATPGMKLTKYLLGQINACFKLIDLNEFPARMATLDKAQFICGYHSTSPKTKNGNQENDNGNNNDDDEN